MFLRHQHERTGPEPLHLDEPRSCCGDPRRLIVMRMGSPTKEEAKTLIAALVAAWDADDEEGVNRLTDSPIQRLAMRAEIMGKPLSVEAVLPCDERRAALVVRNSLGGLSGYMLRRGRDGVLRVDMSSAIGDPRDRASTAASVAEQVLFMATMPKYQEQKPRKKWRAAPPLPELAALPYLGLGRVGVTAAELAALEEAAGAPLPEGYAAYVSRFGEALDAGFVRVYPPERVLRERDVWRRRIDAHWFWRAAEDGFDANTAYDAYVLADTTSGDEFLWHPARADTFYVLPRHHEEVITRTMSFEALLAWATSSNDLGGTIGRYIVPLRDRVSVALRAEQIDPAAVVAVLAALGPDAWTAAGNDGAVVAWPSQGVDVIVSDPPYGELTHEPKSSAAFVQRVLEALASLGITAQ